MRLNKKQLQFDLKDHQYVINQLAQNYQEWNTVDEAVKDTCDDHWLTNRVWGQWPVLRSRYENRLLCTACHCYAAL